MLTREVGPSGSIEQDGRHYAVDGWELFEGDPDSPHMCRGWFRCADPDFAAWTGWEMRLMLSSDNGTNRTLDVRIAHVSSSEPPLYQLMAQR